MHGVDGEEVGEGELSEDALAHVVVDGQVVGGEVHSESRLSAIDEDNLVDSLAHESLYTLILSELVGHKRLTQLGA